MQLHSHLLSMAIVAALAASGPALAAKPDQMPATARALGLIDGNAGALKRADADRFVARDVIVDADGTEHVRFNRTYRGLPVIGGDVVLHSRNGQFKRASLTLKTSGRPDMGTSISGDEATVVAGADFGSDFEGMRAASKVIYARGASPRLAYEVVFTGTKRDQTPTEMHYFVDAKNGKILDKWDMVHTGKGGGNSAKPGGGGGGGGGSTPAVGTGKSFGYGNLSLNTSGSGSSFSLVDTTRGGGSTYDANNRSYSTAARRASLFTDSDNTWGNNQLSDRATIATDAHFGVAKTWDYYKNVHGRNGIFNDGQGVKSYVHVGSNWVNAAWYANAMYYGDGGGAYLPLTSLDIAGHEMSHGVNQATAGLVYSNDAGGLNEANSDIMGTMVEFYANNANDTPDYLIGEGIYASNPSGTNALRYMFRPGDADNNTSYNCYPAGGLGGVDPHYSSGPANHFFYLLAEGAVSPSGFNYSASQLVCNGNTSAGGIGRSKAEKIWYRALTVYMTSNTNYAGARSATLLAASDLYGTTEYNAVASAWSAVGVN